MGKPSVECPIVLTAECKFEHVCNRIINARACFSLHPSYHHYVASKSGGSTRSQGGS